MGSACTERVPLGSWGGLGSSGEAMISGGTPSGGASAGGSTQVSMGGAEAAGAAQGGSGGDASGGAEPTGGRLCGEDGTPDPLNSPTAEPAVALPKTYLDWSSAPESLEWDLRMESDTAKDAFFWTKEIVFSNNLYVLAGLQWQGEFGERQSGEPPDLSNMLVFWVSNGQLRRELVDIVEPNARFAVRSDNWGMLNAKYDFSVCRTYHFRFARDTAHSTTERWYGLWVTDTETQEQVQVGRYLVPNAWGRLTTTTDVWSTRTGITDLEECSQLEYASALFSNFTANDGALKPTALRRQPKSEMIQGCPGTRITLFPDAVRHELGVPAP